MTESFPENYADSRIRFCRAVDALGAKRISLALDVEGMSGLYIDVALIGAPELPAIIVSSGLHGVEGAFGAAIQLAWLAKLKGKPIHARYVLLHALNPYGYAMGRRVNEDNVDLNRNFLQSYSELSVGDYGRFDALLNPACAPSRFDMFSLKALTYLAREGRQQLQDAIVRGQYAYPQGLFYGGVARSQTVRIIEEHMPDWVGESPEVCHLDFHTGLGAFAHCQLMIQTELESARYQWCEKAFGASELVATGKAGPIEKISAYQAAYQANGAMGDWLMQRFDDRPYHFVTAEFGTCSSVKVLSALRTENQAFHYCATDSAARVRARKRLEDCFCPRSQRWRRHVVARGVHLIEQAGRALYVDVDHTEAGT